MQVPIAGTPEFIREWVSTKMGIIKRVLEGVRGLSNKHAALYLLRKAGHGCRVLYYLRTTPREMIADFVQEFDAELRETLEAVAGLSLDEGQWERSGMRVKQSGLGLCRAGDIADVAYLSSRAGAFDDCVALDGMHVWDDGPARDNGAGDVLDDVVGEWLLGCVTQVNSLLPPQTRFDFGRRPEHTVKQGLLMEIVNKEKHTQFTGYRLCRRPLHNSMNRRKHDSIISRCKHQELDESMIA